MEDKALVKFPPVVKLNVGGTKYITRLETLQKYAESMLGAMFSGRYDIDTDDEGNYFIDRNGEYFNHILQFLRDDKYLPPKRLVEPVYIEANYYAISQFRERLLCLPPLYPFGDEINRPDPISNYKDIKTALLTKGKDRASLEDTAVVYVIFLCKVTANDHVYPRNITKSLGHHIRNFVMPDEGWYDIDPENHMPPHLLKPEAYKPLADPVHCLHFDTANDSDQAVRTSRCLEHDLKKEGYIVKFEAEKCKMEDFDIIDMYQYLTCHLHAKFTFSWVFDQDSRLKQ